MTVAFVRPTHQQSWERIFGACFDTYEWWGVIRKAWSDYYAPDWWTVEVVVADPDKGDDLRMVVSHAILMGAIEAIARGEFGRWWRGPCGHEVSEGTEEACLAFLQDPESTLFDPWIADEVMQVATLGEVVYG